MSLLVFCFNCGFYWERKCEELCRQGYPELRIAVIVGLVVVVRLCEHYSDKVVEFFSLFSHSLWLI